MDELEEARSMFIGYSLGKKGFSLRELVSGMGLKLSEWKTLKPELKKMFDDLEYKEIEEEVRK